jgi:ethanolamine utilization protein EutQ
MPELSSNPVRMMPFDEAFTAENGPVKVDRRSKPSELVELSAGFVTFPAGGATDPWTLPYEEVFYVVEGELTIHLDGTPIIAAAGDVVTLEKGVTVVYEGAPGTRAFFSLVPANWLEAKS